MKLKLSNDMTYAGIKILRKIVEVENVNNKTPSYFWKTEEVEKFIAGIKSRQQNLVECDTVQLLVCLLSQKLPSFIQIEAIKAFVAILLGGNTQA